MLSQKNAPQSERFFDNHYKEEPDLGKFQFRASNRWATGGYNRTTIKGFYGASEEHGAEERAFVLEADEPPVLDVVTHGTPVSLRIEKA